jgi:phthiodiolone/phenolphthiodiolone dimycocerosates ketoreductase
MDTEPYEGKFPKIWGAGSGPRMMEIIGKYCDGWIPGTITSPDDYAAKLKAVRLAAEKAGRDPMALETPFMAVALIANDDKEIAEIVEAPLIKSLVMQTPARVMRQFGFEHPLGDEWRGIQDITPEALPKERVMHLIKNFNPEAFLAITPHGPPAKIAKLFKSYIDAGAKTTFKVMDYAGMAGLKYGAKSAQNLRATEDEIMRLVG